MGLRESFESFLSSCPNPFSGPVEFETLLSRITYYRIGGPAEILLTPKTLDDLHLIHSFLRENPTRVAYLGWGSNLLVSDEGLRGVVIRMKHLFTEIEEGMPGLLKVGASVGGSTLLRRAQMNGYGGLSHLTGIPGSIGGMVAMNAGTHLGEMKDCVTQVEIVNLAHDEFKPRTEFINEGSFSYRHNHFLKPGDLVIHALLKYMPEDPKKVEVEINQLYTRRKETQPVDLPSCGSVFMNPIGSGLHAWQVIDRLGLRGHRIGQAQISEKHSNFIVNLGGAKASDVKALIDLVQRRAYDEMGIQLQTEVKYLL